VHDAASRIADAEMRDALSARRSTIWRISGSDARQSPGVVAT
jgi:hypothetical protein